jgi:hypothetical protein
MVKIFDLPAFESTLKPGSGSRAEDTGVSHYGNLANREDDKGDECSGGKIARMAVSSSISTTT